jgi:hypothetical protein
VVAVLVTGCSDGGGGDGGSAMCERKVDLVDEQSWTIVGLDDDPFVPADAETGDGAVDGRPVCTDADSFFEVFVGEDSWTILTRTCGWGTIVQPGLVAVRAGEEMTLRIWFFEHLASFGATAAHLSVTIGDRELWSRELPLPQTESGLVLERIAAPWDVAVGEPIRWHVDNHGSNSWNFLELSVLEPVPCDELDAGP